MTGSSRQLRFFSLVLLAGLAAANLRAAGPGDTAEGVCLLNSADGVLTTDGYLEVVGFAVDPRDGAPVAKVDLLVDGHPVGGVSLGGFRPDVVAHFARADYLWSGWRGTVRLRDLWPGARSVSAVAHTRSGRAISCDSRIVEVLPGTGADRKDPWRIGLETLVVAAVLVGWLALVGFPVALLTGRSPLGLRSPFLGLALFAVATEAGRLLDARPFGVAVFLTAVSAVVLAGLFLSGRARIRRISPGTLPALAFMAVFAVIGVIPLASHGEGAVLGSIDDAVRESAIADSISMWGWAERLDVPGFLGSMPHQARKIHMREGGAYLLSAVARGFDVRAHAVHAGVTLAAGCLVIGGAGLLAQRILRRGRAVRSIPAGLVAINSVLLATLYGQHFGSLLFAALSLAFLFHLLALLRAWSPLPAVSTGLLIAGAWSLYPEGLASWGLAGVLALALTTSGDRRRRTLRRLVGAGLLSLALNPVGAARAVRFYGHMSSSAPMSSSYERLLTGDTHYFPSLDVVTGTRAYREDAPAPVGAVRSVAIPAVTVLMLVVAGLGWAALRGGQKRLLVLLLLPVALALYVNHRWGFPYGYAKYLPLAVPLWAVGFSILAYEAAQRGKLLRSRWRTALVTSAVTLLAISALPGARHVVRRAMVEVPSYDPAFRELPALARAVRRDAIIRLDEPAGARRFWIAYFLGETELALPSQVSPAAPERRMRLIDRRKIGGALPPGALASTRTFVLVPLGNLSEPGS